MAVQNQVSHLFLQDPNLHQREEAVLSEIITKTGFSPSKRIGESRYWDSTAAGAAFYQGEFEDKPALLKIQAVKTPVSEIDQIKNFQKFNRSQIIRPPKILTYLRWQEELQYEALIMEKVVQKKIVTLPTTTKQLTRFFQLYDDYRQHCLHTPWLDKPDHHISDKIMEGYSKWRQIRQKLYSDHPHIRSKDDQLIDRSVALLVKEYRNIDPEFVHGHFSHNDLLLQPNGDIILLSNLYWSWRPPFYNTIFAYHWFIYHLAGVKEISPQNIESQRQLWFSYLHRYASTSDQKKLLNLALLERATAGLNLDVLSIDPSLPISTYLIESTRIQLKNLFILLSK